MSEPLDYATVREFLGACIGATILDITQHDEEDFIEDKRGEIHFHLDNGWTLTVTLHENPDKAGFSFETPDGTLTAINGGLDHPEEPEGV